MRFLTTKVQSPKLKHYSGIDSKTLMSLIENTAPFLFTHEAQQNSKEWLTGLHIYREQLDHPQEDEKINTHLWPYFNLCLLAHFSTVGTFVPTDVDLAIREKLWSHVHSEDTFIPMWEQTLEFLNWDERLVSKRVVYAKSGRKISGHQGEWLSVAVGAYKAAKRLSLPQIAEVRKAIEENVNLQEEALKELKVALDGASEALEVSAKDYLAGVASIVHNLGDLDRQLEGLDEIDLLKRRYYRLGHEDGARKSEVFFEAGQMYQKFLASENHRHFALREPKALRKSSEFLLPYAPFLDDWGKQIICEGFLKEMLNDREIREIVQALVEGWMKLNTQSIFDSVGYARALAGMEKALSHKTGKGLESLLPVQVARKLNECGIRSVMQKPQKVFEQEYARKILDFLEESPTI